MTNIVGVNWVGLRNPAAWRTWFKSTSAFWLAVVVLIAVPLLVHWVRVLIGGALVTELQFSGLLLEIGGVAAVAIGIGGKIEAYGGESIWGRLVNGFKAMPVLRKKVTGQGQLVVGNLVTKGHLGTVKVSSPKDESIKARVERLEHDVQSTNRALEQAIADSMKRDEDLGVTIVESAKALNANILELSEKSSEASLGDVGLEVAGLVWVVAGMILAAVPEQAAAFIDPLQQYFCIVGC